LYVNGNYRSKGALSRDPNTNLSIEDLRWTFVAGITSSYRF